MKELNGMEYKSSSDRCAESQSFKNIFALT